jgi:hypothetical protein
LKKCTIIYNGKENGQQNFKKSKEKGQWLIIEMQMENKS